MSEESFLKSAGSDSASGRKNSALLPLVRGEVKGGRIIDNLQIDNLTNFRQIDNRQIDNRQIDNRQIDNLTNFRQIDNWQIDNLTFSKIVSAIPLSWPHDLGNWQHGVVIFIVGE